MEHSKEEKELIEKFEEQIKKEKEIVDLFNSLREATFKNYFEKLEIHDDEKLLIFELVSRCLYYLEETANESEDNYDSLIAINVFKALFMDKYKFKMDAFDSKKYCFNLVLKLFSDEHLSDAEQEMINKGIIKYNIFDEISKDFDDNYYYVYCLYLIFEYSASKLFFLDTFIAFMKKMFKDEKDVELEIRKDENISEFELDKINQDVLLKSLHDIYYKEENYYILYINNNELQKKDIPYDELAKIFNEVPKSAVKSKKNKKKTKKVESFISDNKNQKENETQGENKIPEENKIQKENKTLEENKIVIKRVENLIIINKDKNKEETQKIKDNQIAIQKNEKTKSKIINTDNSSKESISQDQYNQLSLKINELVSIINELNEESKIKTAQINELNEKDKLKTAQINELNEESKIITAQINKLNEKDKLITAQINKLKEESKIKTAQINKLNEESKIKTAQINKLNKKDTIKTTEINEMKANTEKRNKINQKKFQNMRNDFEKIEKDLIKIKCKLKKIKLGDVFRNIIDNSEK